MSVDLPEPDGPMTASSSPGCDVERDAAERVDGGVALAVAARESRAATTVSVAAAVGDLGHALQPSDRPTR